MKLFRCFILGLVWAATAISCQQKKEIKGITTANGSSFEKEHFDNFFKNLMDSLTMPGLSVAIINDSKIVYHEALGTQIAGKEIPVTKNTYFEAASLSKPLFSFFALKQVDKQILDLDTPLHTYLPNPDIAYDERYRKVTARMILSHTAGFPNWRGDSLTIDFEPGTQFQYSGEGYRYLASVLAAVNKVSMHQLDSIFQQEIAKPLGANQLYYKWNTEIANNKATGHLNGAPTDNLEVRKDLFFGSAGGLHSEASNYSKFVIAMMQKELISEKSYTELFKEQIPLPETDINAIVMKASGWSLGMGMIPTEYGMCYWHSGNNQDFQSWFHFFPELNYGIVLFTNSDTIQSPEFFIPFFNFLDDGIAFDISALE